MSELLRYCEEKRSIIYCSVLTWDGPETPNPTQTALSVTPCRELTSCSTRDSMLDLAPVTPAAKRSRAHQCVRDAVHAQPGQRRIDTTSVL